MARRTRSPVVLALIGGVLVWMPGVHAAGPTDHKAAANKPFRVEAISGSNVKKLTLTEKAVQRLDITTSDVRVDSSGRKIIPYAAIIYHKDGTTWVYTNPQPQSFIRHSVVVDAIQGDDAWVKEGPAAGVKVAVTGVSELYGAEMGVGH